MKKLKRTGREKDKSEEKNKDEIKRIEEGGKEKGNQRATTKRKQSQGAREGGD